MLVHELRAVISPPTSEVKLKQGLLSSDENRLIHSFVAEHKALWRPGCVVGKPHLTLQCLTPTKSDQTAAAPPHAFGVDEISHICLVLLCPESANASRQSQEARSH
jgi:hypothetical protein